MGKMGSPLSLYTDGEWGSSDAALVALCCIVTACLILPHKNYEIRVRIFALKLAVCSQTGS